jgi:hypothetical protein
MAWYEGTMTNAAGQLVSILDAKLLLNSCWEIVDTPNTNERVYGHKFNGTRDFVFVLKDNQADYATVELWDDWDTETHVGVGNSITTVGSYTFRIRKTGGGWGLRVTDNCFVLAVKGGGWAYYIGQAKRFNTSRNTPVFIGHTSSAGHTYYGANPVSSSNFNTSTSTPIVWMFLRDSAGVVGNRASALGLSNGTSVSSDTYTSKWPIKTTAGTYIVFESVLAEYSSSKLAIGHFDGAFCGWVDGAGLSNGDTINVEGVGWLVVLDGYNNATLIRMD